MKQLKRLTMMLALLLTAVASAWADKPKIYYSAVAISDLKEGDILAEGFSVTGNDDDYIEFDGNRHKNKGYYTGADFVMPFNTNPSFGANGVITSGTDVFTPLDENGQDGNGWLVTSAGVNGEKHYIKLVGINVPGTVSPVANEANQWEFIMPDGNVEVTIRYKEVSQMSAKFEGEAVDLSEGVTGYLGMETAFADGLVPAIEGVDAAMFSFESSDADVIAFRSIDNASVLEAKGALSNIVFLKEGTAKLTIRFAGNDDYGRAEIEVPVKVEEPLFTVIVDDGGVDTQNWSVAPADATDPEKGVKPGTEIKATYGGTKHVKSVTAVAMTENHYKPLTMEALSKGNIVVEISSEMEIGMKYAVNGGEKNVIKTTTEIKVKAGDKVEFYGNGTSIKCYGDIPKVTIKGDAITKVYGNIMSLIDEENFATATSLQNEKYVFAGLFDGNEDMTDASGLVLPARKLTDGCYMNMFCNCTALTKAPALPATTLAKECYWGMFTNCYALTAAPALPATTLAEGCYRSMFTSCWALKDAPVLPATTLAKSCYCAMFSECIALKEVPDDMLPATTLAENCYEIMFANSTSLTKAPVLPAEALVKKCYYEMFNGCSNLTSVTCLARTGINTDESTEKWLKDVKPTGTFFKAASAMDWTTDNNGIPSGWTIEIAP